MNLLYVHCPWAYRPLYRLYKTTSDKAERSLLRSKLERGMVVVDVGANIGVYSAFFADCVGTEGKVYSFEPDAANYRFLRRVAARHSSITPVQAAVGETSGTTQLYISADLNVDHHTYDDGSGRPAVDVRLVSLDSFFPSGSRINFVKLDIQGYEWHALQGAYRVLTENPGIQLLFEYWPYGLTRAGVNPPALLHYLQGIGFRLRSAEGRELDLGRLAGGGVGDYTNVYATR